MRQRLDRCTAWQRRPITEIQHDLPDLKRRHCELSLISLSRLIMLDRRNPSKDVRRRGVANDTICQFVRTVAISPCPTLFSLSRTRRSSWYFQVMGNAIQPGSIKVPANRKVIGPWLHRLLSCRKVDTLVAQQMCCLPHVCNKARDRSASAVVYTKSDHT